MGSTHSAAILCFRCMAVRALRSEADRRRAFWSNPSAAGGSDLRQREKLAPRSAETIRVASRSRTSPSQESSEVGRGRVDEVEQSRPPSSRTGETGEGTMKPQ